MTHRLFGREQCLEATAYRTLLRLHCRALWNPCLVCVQRHQFSSSRWGRILVNAFHLPGGRSRTRTCTHGASNRCSTIGAIRPFLVWVAGFKPAKPVKAMVLQTIATLPLRCTHFGVSYFWVNIIWVNTFRQHSLLLIFLGLTFFSATFFLVNDFGG